MPDLDTTLRWAHDGTALFRAALDHTEDERLDALTALRPWTGKHLVAHVAANAEALLNLAYWARTGRETPMYSSPTQRDADISTGAEQPADLLRKRVAASADALADALAALEPGHWQRLVRTAQGRDVPATQIPWMRAREVMVHAVDLGSGVGFADLPEDFLVALLDDVTAKRSTGPAGPALVLSAAGRAWSVDGTGEPVELSGPLPDVAAYLTGRSTRTSLTSSTGVVPALPAWL